ncbi:MAG: prepilin-type N-terminal cleavage/methylation domain-containing protein [Candidatus Omnitrophica bacterium]|nr:prepilin-type N-terminal cleavage/methylation domain-containing protein [Candidatus Omnitrophota bacterium]MDD5436047.1 prepilin-type N-terminal cleavage/methylation domain-containing protein [Candidatus Omnitrophota bacterium]
MITKRIRSRGFTLTEVVVAVCLLTIVWLAAINIMVISAASGSLAKHKAQAQYKIQQTIEATRRKTFSTITNGVTVTNNESIDTKSTPDSTADDLKGTQTVTVTTPNVYYKKVLVQLTWNESFFGRRKSVSEYAGTFIASDQQAN